MIEEKLIVHYLENNRENNIWDQKFESSKQMCMIERYLMTFVAEIMFFSEFFLLTEEKIGRHNHLRIFLISKGNIFERQSKLRTDLTDRSLQFLKYLFFLLAFNNWLILFLSTKK